MKTYYFSTDSSSGEVVAQSATEALAKVVAEESITDAAIADGAWAWV